MMREEEIETLDAQRHKVVKHLDRIVVKIDYGEETIRLAWETTLEVLDSPYSGLVAGPVPVIYAAAIIGLSPAVDAHANIHAVAAQHLDEGIINERSICLDTEGDFKVLPRNVAYQCRIAIQLCGTKK